MNIRSEAEMALEEALKEHLRHLMRTALTRVTAHEDESADTALLAGLKKAGKAYYAAQKLLEEL